MTISAHKATIGRKLWVWVDSEDGVVDVKQAFDATVILVNLDDTVDVFALSHSGSQMIFSSVEVHDPEPSDQHMRQDENVVPVYATWMPFQKNQMDKQGQEEKMRSFK